MLVKKQPNTSPPGQACIRLSPRVLVLIDSDDYVSLCRYHWRLKRSGACFYAIRRIHRNGKTYEIKMHRVIAKTPQGYECHHKNHNTLDNRKCNLQNLSPSDHVNAHNANGRGGVYKLPSKST